MPTPLTLVPDSGPPAPPSSRPHAGLWTDLPVARYGPPAQAHDGVPRLAVTGAAGQVGNSGQVLQVAIYPARTNPVGDESDVTVEVRSHGPDGQSWLADEAGNPVDGSSPGALLAEQWNLLTAPAGARHISVHGGGVTGWVQARQVRAERLPEDVLDQVSTIRGSHSGFAHSRGNTAPVVAAPHGMIHLGPITDADDASWHYRWHSTNLVGVAVTTRPSPWLGGPAWLQVLPCDVDGGYIPVPLDHDAEADRPHRYRHPLPGGGAGDGPGDGSVQLTATERTGAVLVTGVPALALRAPDGQMCVEHLDGGRVRVRVRSVRVGEPERRPVVGHVVVETVGAVVVRASGATGDVLMVAPTDVLELRFAFSYLSHEQALRTLEQENRPHSFAELSRRTGEQWHTLLERLELLGATDAQTRTARTALARLYLWPSLAHENAGTIDHVRWVHADLYGRTDGTVPGQVDQVPAVDGPLYVNNGYWDTYRTCWPAYALLTPDHAAGLLEGILAQFRDGGWMARWAAPGYADCMVGTSSDVVFADAATYRIPGWDEVTAYDSALRDATVPADEPAVGRRDLARSRFRGWVTDDVPEGFSWSVESALCDDAMSRWADDLARRADALGYPERAAQWRADARYLGHRALAVRGLFDPGTCFFRGRDVQDRPSSAVGDFDPARWGGDFAETNAWGMSVSTVHDGPGMAALYQRHGGGLAAHLDRLHAEPETAAEAWCGTYPGVIHEMTEARSLRTGMCALSNQPAHHIPFMELHAGRPWRTQELTRDALERLFTGAEIGQGYPGDEDNGEMSAWWLFTALGLYPLHPGSGELVLTAPLLEQMRWTRADGTVLQVRTTRPDGTTLREARYIASVRVNGQVWERVSIAVETLRGDCLVEVELSTAPTSWGAASRPAGAAVDVPEAGWLVDATPRATVRPATMAALVDDDGSGVVHWPAGVALTLTWPGLVDADHLTVTLDAPARFAVEIRTGERWRSVAPLDLHPAWSNQTVPGLLPAPRLRALRLRALDDAHVRQVEVFGEMRRR
ncbi:glycoside hydrolase family 92 protein [Ruania alkalisoli]|uniref:Glycoside hydrolase family 92 protein n=1 Tax=Ruania alkalisoli TaxID=2779775 RepID=A0A7M1SSD8_9MICO|nr:glycoside hydrolase domain-containing protein [Ruania alkalisoli]QOR69904.1 glycoside hydrolase family 92 protein [Ruania alkalisoli]